MNKKKFAKMLREHVDDFIASNGVEMSKQIWAGGVFTSPTWDRRTAYSLKEVDDLTREGFTSDTNLGWIAFNAMK
jgi:hypothetical protein